MIFYNLAEEATDFSVCQEIISIVLPTFNYCFQDNAIGPHHDPEECSPPSPVLFL